MDVSTLLPIHKLSPDARAVIAADGCNALLPKAPSDAEAAARLAEIAPAQLLTEPQADQDRADCIKAMLLLWLDDLEISHTLSQGVDTPDGSFIHAIIHRREGDFSNSKYWFARTGQHAAMAELAQHVAKAPGDWHRPQLKRLIDGGTWHGPAYVDFVETVTGHPGSPDHAIAVSLQKLEWAVLMKHLLG